MMSEPAPAPALSDHQRLLNLWRGRLIEARKNYDQVVSELQTNANAGRSDTAGTLPTPNGSTGHILRAETQALNEYMRILRIFTDLVISGKAPVEERTKGKKMGGHSAA